MSSIDDGRHERAAGDFAASDPGREAGRSPWRFISMTPAAVAVALAVMTTSCSDTKKTGAPPAGSPSVSSTLPPSPLKTTSVVVPTPCLDVPAFSPTASPAPQPCLKVLPSKSPGIPPPTHPCLFAPPSRSPKAAPRDTTAPRPCLSIPASASPKATPARRVPPRVCLSVAPHPCLEIVAPTATVPPGACLSVAPPGPCLSPPVTPPTPPPTPCLAPRPE